MLPTFETTIEHPADARKSNDNTSVEVKKPASPNYFDAPSSTHTGGELLGSVSSEEISSKLFSKAVSRDEAIAAFVGKKYEYYREAWTNITNTMPFGAPSFRWNTAAFFGMFLWMSYRKMYRQAAISLSVMLVFNLVVLLLQKRFNFYSNGLDISINLTIGTIFAYLGNGIYKRHVASQVDSMMSSDTPVTGLPAFANKGGVNKIAPWLMALLFIFGIICTGILVGADL